MTALIIILGILALLAGGFFSVKITEEVTPATQWQSEIRKKKFGFRWPFALGGFATAMSLFVLSAFVTSTGIVTVDAGNTGVVKHFGNPVGQLPPGIHGINPFGDTVTPVTFQSRIVQPSENAASHDLQIVHIQVTFKYHTDPKFATDILTRLNDDAENRVINPAILEAIKAVTAQYDVKELISQRPKVRDQIEEFVKQTVVKDHIIAESVSITDFSFSKEYEDAIEAKVTAEQNAEKAKNDLERIKIEASQKIAAAEGEAAALKAQKSQITPELLQLRMIEMLDKKWDGQLPQNYYGGTSPLPIVEALKGTKKQ